MIPPRKPRGAAKPTLLKPKPKPKSKPKPKPKALRSGTSVTPNRTVPVRGSSPAPGPGTPVRANRSAPGIGSPPAPRSATPVKANRTVSARGSPTAPGPSTPVKANRRVPAKGSSPASRSATPFRANRSLPAIGSPPASRSATPVRANRSISPRVSPPAPPSTHEPSPPATPTPEPAQSTPTSTPAPSPSLSPSTPSPRKKAKLPTNKYTPEDIKFCKKYGYSSADSMYPCCFDNCTHVAFTYWSLKKHIIKNHSGDRWGNRIEQNKPMNGSKRPVVEHQSTSEQSTSSGQSISTGQPSSSSQSSTSSGSSGLSQTSGPKQSSGSTRAAGAKPAARPKQSSGSKQASISKMSTVSRSRPPLVKLEPKDNSSDSDTEFSSDGEDDLLSPIPKLDYKKKNKILTKRQKLTQAARVRRQLADIVHDIDEGLVVHVPIVGHDWKCEQCDLTFDNVLQYLSHSTKHIVQECGHVCEQQCKNCPKTYWDMLEQFDRATALFLDHRKVGHESSVQVDSDLDSDLSATLAASTSNAAIPSTSSGLRGSASSSRLSSSNRPRTRLTTTINVSVEQAESDIEIEEFTQEEFDKMSEYEDDDEPEIVKVVPLNPESTIQVITLSSSSSDENMSEEDGLLVSQQASRAPVVSGQRITMLTVAQVHNHPKPDIQLVGEGQRIPAPAQAIRQQMPTNQPYGQPIPAPAPTQAIEQQMPTKQPLASGQQIPMPTVAQVPYLPKPNIQLVVIGQQISAPAQAIRQQMPTNQPLAYAQPIPAPAPTQANIQQKPTKQPMGWYAQRIPKPATKSPTFNPSKHNPRVDKSNLKSKTREELQLELKELESKERLRQKNVAAGVIHGIYAKLEDTKVRLAHQNKNRGGLPTRASEPSRQQSQRQKAQQQGHKRALPTVEEMYQRAPTIPIVDEQVEQQLRLNQQLQFQQFKEEEARQKALKRQKVSEQRNDRNGTRSSAQSQFMPSYAN